MTIPSRQLRRRRARKGVGDPDVSEIYALNPIEISVVPHPANAVPFLVRKAALSPAQQRLVTAVETLISELPDEDQEPWRAQLQDAVEAGGDAVLEVLDQLINQEGDELVDEDEEQKQDDRYHYTKGHTMPTMTDVIANSPAFRVAIAKAERAGREPTIGEIGEAICAAKPGDKAGLALICCADAPLAASVALRKWDRREFDSWTTGLGLMLAPRIEVLKAAASTRYAEGDVGQPGDEGEEPDTEPVAPPRRQPGESAVAYRDRYAKFKQQIGKRLNRADREAGR